jgi:hypothetical protein
MRCRVDGNGDVVLCLRLTGKAPFLWSSCAGSKQQEGRLKNEASSSLLILAPELDKLAVKCLVLGSSSELDEPVDKLD